MNFKKWFYINENNGENPDVPWGKHGIHHRIKFNDVKFDTIEKYYADIDKAKSTITDLDKINIGDKIADYVASNAPYWIVTNIDETKKRIFLEPIPPNPYTPNPEGKVIGAGGHEFTQHDFDVASGSYEKERIDHLLDIINKKEYHDINDVKYILLGTVPVQMGPNGAQGGWYNCRDIHSNRGGKKGMEPEEIIKKDAETLKNKLGFSVPQSALNGTLKPSLWNDFVDGSSGFYNDYEHYKLPEEDHDVPEKIAEIILTHKQPSVRKRNAEILLRKFGDNEKYTDLIRKIALEFAKQPAVGEHYDKNYLAKEMFIRKAEREKWYDILEAFENAPDANNRKYVAFAYDEDKDTDKLIRMFNRETRAEPMSIILQKLAKKAFTDHNNIDDGGRSNELYKFIFDNEDKIKRIAENEKDTYYDKEMMSEFKKAVHQFNLQKYIKDEKNNNN